MNVFFNWKKIEEITRDYRRKAEESVREGLFVFPHVMGFVKAEPIGVHVAVCLRQLADKNEIEGFVRYLARGLPRSTQLEAAGFLIMLPRSLAEDFVDVGPRREDVDRDVVLLLHVEHVYCGFRTWILDHADAGWTVASSGLVSSMPPCLPAWVYGTGSLGSA